MIITIINTWKSHAYRQLYVVRGSQNDLMDVVDWVRESIDDKMIEVFNDQVLLTIRGTNNLVLFKLRWSHVIACD